MPLWRLRHDHLWIEGFGVLLGPRRLSFREEFLPNHGKNLRPNDYVMRGPVGPSPGMYAG